MSNSGTTKARILQAALNLVQDEGAARLTLARVADRAGVSKGGLLYHFPSKARLIAALLGSYVESYEARLRARQEPGERAGSWARANLSVVTSEEEVHRHAPPIVSLLAAVASDRRLLGEVREASVRWQQQAEEDGLPRGLGTLLRLALDGWWYARVFDLPLPDGDQQEAFAMVYRRLSFEGTA